MKLRNLCLFALLAIPFASQMCPLPYGEMSNVTACEMRQSDTSDQIALADAKSLPTESEVVAE